MPRFGARALHLLPAIELVRGTPLLQRFVSCVVCSVALTACGSTDSVGAGGDHIDGGGHADGDNVARCGEVPVKLVDYVGEVPDAGRSAVQIPTIGVAGDDLFYVLNWYTPLGAPVGPGGYLMRVPIRGGAPVQMADVTGGGSASGRGLVVTRDAAVFAEARLRDGGEGAIVSVPTGGGEPTTLALTTGLANAVVADDRNVYFVDGAGTKSVPLTGGAVRTLTDEKPFSIMVSESTLYMAEYGSPGGISSVPTSGGPVVVLATDPGGALYPVRCGQNVCWTSGLPSSGFSLKQLDPVGNVSVLATGLSEPNDLVFDGDNFFVSTGVLDRIPAAGGEPIVIQASEGLSSLAVDDACLYWSSLSGVYAWARSAAATAMLGP